MKELNVRISVIVPCHNLAGYVPACLDSLAAQTFDSFEVICIDDGSTDATGLIMDERAEADSRFKVIHQEHRGPSAARNAGVAASAGELIAFVDGDDYVSNRYLEVLETLMKLHNADMACCSHITARAGTHVVLDDDEDAVARALDLAEELDSIAAMRYIATETIHFSFWSKLMTRELAESCPFPEGMVYEDMWNLGIATQKADCIVYAPIPLYCYVSRGDSITRARPKPMDRFWQFREAVEKFEAAYTECLGLDHATDDGPYCLHLAHRLCGQYVTLCNSVCDNSQRKALEAGLHDELDATYRLALNHGISPTHPQMIRAYLLLRSPKLHDAAFAAYRFVKGS